MMNAHKRKLFLRKWARTLHIYISMLGLIVVTFFAATGFILNHEEWFGYAEPITTTHNGNIPPALLTAPDKLGIVEILRKDLGATGAMDSFEVNEDELAVIFKSPGRRTQATIAHPGGEAEVTIDTHGFIGRLVELHRGVEAGPAWRLVIDATAILLVIIGLTGLILWLSVPKWRPLGLTAAGVCVVVCAGVYFTLVP
jgi:hypothetical protein